MSYIGSGEGAGMISIDLGDFGLEVPAKLWGACEKAVGKYKTLKGCLVEVGHDGWLRVKTDLPKYKAGEALESALKNLESMITRTCKAKAK